MYEGLSGLGEEGEQGRLNKFLISTALGGTNVVEMFMISLLEILGMLLLVFSFFF